MEKVGYSGVLNEQRIATYKRLAKEYNVSESQARDIFSEGMDFTEKIYTAMKLDKNGKVLKNNDIINIHQTINGENMFFVQDLEKKDIRYIHDITYKYQYSVDELLNPNPLNGIVTWEIIGTLNTD